MPSPPHFGVLVLTILVVGVALPLLGSLGLGLWAGEWTWHQEPLHSVAEGTGALIALALGAFLLIRSRLDDRPFPSLWPARALIAMGLFDAAHAAALPGQTFVWLHSVATLLGGLFFALVWLPKDMTRHAGHRPVTIGIALIALASIVLHGVVPELSPRMVTAGIFTPLARLMNVAGGLLFYVAALHFALRCRRRDEPWDDLIFAVHCALFGSAGVLFELSQLWNASWWWWHVLRLGAYAAAISYIARTYWSAELRILQLNHDLTLSNLELERFAQVASHDLREPLRKLISFSDLLACDLGPGLSEPAKKHLFFIRDSAMRMQRLIRSLLVLSRVSRDDMRVATVSVESCVDRALESLDLRIHECGARIVCGTLPAVRADPTLLTSIYQNLIHNSLKFAGRDPPLIHLDAERGAAGWVLGVRDNGIGIDPRRVGEIFRPFQRLHDRDAYAGAGIGLSICRRAVERHGGRIWVAESSSSGTQVQFTLGA